MFKFLSGVASGWIAARILPPKSPDVSPLSLPTLIELNILAEHAYTIFEKANDKFNELDQKKTNAPP